jgi:GT2 family glycosyltransferase
VSSRKQARAASAAWLTDDLLLLVAAGDDTADARGIVRVGALSAPLAGPALSIRARDGEGERAAWILALAGTGRNGATPDAGDAGVEAVPTELRTLLREDLAGLDAETRERLLDFVVTRAAPRLQLPGGFSLARSLRIVRDALREHVDSRRVGRDEPLGLNVDMLMAVDEKTLWVEGWLRDADGVVTRLEAMSPEGLRVDLLAGAHRHARPDVELALGPLMSGAPNDFGYVTCVQLPAPSKLESGWILSVRRPSGSGVELEAPAVQRDPLVVRDRILSHFAADAPGTENLIAEHAHPALSRLQERQRDAVEVERVTQYGEPPADPDVSIVVPLYRRIDYLQHQMAQFVSDPEIGAADVIYVLDWPEARAAVAESAASLHELYGVPFRVVDLAENSGYANANNAATALARGRLLLLLNSDVIPDRPGWLGRMVEFYDATPGIGALGPKLLYEDDSLQHAGMYFRREPKSGLWGNHHYFKGFHRHFAEANVARPVPAVTGACLLIDRALYDQVGGFSPLYVQGGYEDSDLCLRLKVAGRENWYLPHVELYHLEAQSFYFEGLRQLTNKYNMWLQTHLWNDLIAELSASEPLSH